MWREQRDRLASVEATEDSEVPITVEHGQGAECWLVLIERDVGNEAIVRYVDGLWEASL